MKTLSKSKEAAISSRSWHLVDATGLTLGRIASEVANIIRGKHKVDYTPHVDCGDFVVVINAANVRLSGKKLSGKTYIHHTNFPGGLKSISAADLLKKHPERLISFAVKGMLPRGALGHQMVKKLKVYAGAEHPHGAQKISVLKPKYVQASA